MKLSADLCDKMVARYKSGRGYETISKALNVPRSDVASVIVKWQQCGTTRALSGFYTVQPNWVRARTMTTKSAVSQKTWSKMHKKSCSLDSKTQFNRNLNSGSVLLLELKVALLTSWASVLPWRLTAAYYSRSACIVVLNQWVVNIKRGSLAGACGEDGQKRNPPMERRPRKWFCWWWWKMKSQRRWFSSLRWKRDQLGDAACCSSSSHWRQQGCESEKTTQVYRWISSHYGA